MTKEMTTKSICDRTRRKPVGRVALRNMCAVRRLPCLWPLFLMLACGCAFQSSKLYDPTSGKIVAKSRTYTFFDSQSSLAKLHIDTMIATNKGGTWSPGISISGLSQESSSTNAAHDLGTTLGAAFKAYTGGR